MGEDCRAGRDMDTDAPVLDKFGKGTKIMGALDFLGSIGGVGGAIQGVAGLAGLFGGHANYGSAGDLSSGRNYLSALGGIGSAYTRNGQNANADYTADNGAYRSALGNEAAYLNTNPYTSQYDTAALARSGAGSADAYSRARANLMASGAARGVGGAGSSGVAGGLAGIETGQAGQIAGAQSQLGYNQIQQHQNNLAALTQLYSGVSNQDYGRGQQALGQQQNLYGDLSHEYLGLGQNEQYRETSQNQQQLGAAAQGLGGLASAYGTAQAYKNNPFGAARTPGISPAAPSPYSYPPLDYSGYTPQYPSIQTPDQWAY